MATAWRDIYTDLSTINNGNEIEDGDTATGEHITVALENGAYAKKLADQNAADIVTINGDIDSIEQRLTTLGFKTGAATTSGIIVNQYTYQSNSVKKIGKYVLFSFVIGNDSAPYPAWNSSMASQAHTITVPDWAKPKRETTILYQLNEFIDVVFDNGETVERTTVSGYVSHQTTISTNGVINITCGGRVSGYGSDIRVSSNYAYPKGAIIILTGWETN